MHRDEADAVECAGYLYWRYGVELERLLDDPMALAEVYARWHIRDELDTEELAWINELIRWQRVSAERIGRMAQQLIREFEVPLSGLCVQLAAA